MKTIIVFLKWCYMLTKRLYKKPGYVFLLLLIPVVVGIYSVTAQEDSGIMTIVVAQEDENDSFSAELVDSFIDSSPIILFVKADSCEKAVELVSMQKADAAWIFPADIEQRLHGFLQSENGSEALVRVVVRENTIPIMLANEKLSGTMFQYCARMYYLQYLRQNAEYLSEVTDEEILSYYDSAVIGEQLFSYYNINGVEQKTEDMSANYLLTPVRGILGVLIVLCGMGTALFYMEDDAAGVFSWLHIKRKPFVEFGYQLISAMNISFVALVSLAVSGLAESLIIEIPAMLLFCICSASFGQLLRTLFGNQKILAIFLPLLVVVMIAVCPVFYDLAALRYLQLLFPPTYFVNTLYNPDYALFMLLYICLCHLICGIARKIRNH